MNPPPFRAGVNLLLTDGTILVHEVFTNNWWKFTPDIRGVYVNGTWARASTMRADYIPIDYASAVLNDGRVVVSGCESNFSTGSNNIGAVYDPLEDQWTNLAGPQSWLRTGDAVCTVLPSGKMFVGDGYGVRNAALDPKTLNWATLGNAQKHDIFDEEQGTLLPDGTVFVLDYNGSPYAEKYIPWLGAWVPAGITPGILRSNELGPTVLMFDGRVFATGGTGATAIYTPAANPTDQGTWLPGPLFPFDVRGYQLGIPDGGACLLPNGNVLCVTCPVNGQLGNQFFEFDGTKLTHVPGTQNDALDFSELECMLMLPSGQVFYTDQSKHIEIYTPAGGPASIWRPTITTCPTHVKPNGDYRIEGTQFNGFSETVAHADDVCNATNYPLVRIRNNATGHVTYCRTHDHSTRGVATGSQSVFTNFAVDQDTEPGPSTLEVVANGIPSAPNPIVVDALTVRAIFLSANLIAAGTPITGTVFLTNPAPSGGRVVNVFTSNPAALIPSTVTVPAGATSVDFQIRSYNPGYTVIKDVISASYGTDPAVTARLTIRPGNYAQFVSQDTPFAVYTNTLYTVTLQFKNSGQTTWDATHAYKLQSKNPTDNIYWFVNRIKLTNAPVAPGGIGVFVITFAPSVSGTYNFQWQMIQDSIGVNFGPMSPNVPVRVIYNGDSSRFFDETVPDTVPAGSDFQASLRFTNTGATSWAPPAYSLVSVNPNNNAYWGAPALTFTGLIGPGSTVIINPVFSSPIIPGTYNFQWSMFHIVPFGEPSPPHSIVVTPSANNAQYVTESQIPTSVGPGTTFGATLAMKNLGSATWDFNYSLLSENPEANIVWGFRSMPLSGSAPQGTTAQFTGTFKAPMVAGIYHFQWRMSQNGISFGQRTPDILVRVTDNASQYISRNGPINIDAGTDFWLQYTMKNTGTTSWTVGGGYSMMSLNPANNIVWGRNRLYSPSGVTISPGSMGTFTGLCTAPIVPGAYTMQWQVASSGAGFGETTPLQVVNVTEGLDDAQFVSQAVPTPLTPGATFTANIFMKNLGTQTWSETGYALVAIQGGWGVSSIPASAVPHGETCQFSATLRAPLTTGFFHFQWRMAHNGVKFGQPSQDIVITVAGDSAQFVSRTGPLLINVGSDFYVQNTMKNTGTTTWAGTTGFNMMSQSPINNTTWKINRLYLPSSISVPPGATGTFTGLCRAPITPGTYTMQWQVAKNGVPFGEMSPLLSITVAVLADDSKFISQASIPTSIRRGQQFSASMVMKNTGTASWDSSYGLAAIGTSAWGWPTIQSPPVAPGATVTFARTFTAPSTPGAYTFQWRMQHGTSKFGWATPAVTINVF